jgi:hypothetical protein
MCSRFCLRLLHSLQELILLLLDLKITMANMAEKEEFEVNAQYVETNSAHLSDEKDLSKVQTLGIVDVENKAAYKGDDSDGQVE